MKKQYRILTAVLALTLVNAMPAAAQDVTVLMQEMNDIREDLKILQRQMYNDGGSELVVTVGRLDELVRSTAGRLDELDYKIKQLDEKINLINKDIDVRMKLLEGKKITGSGGSECDSRDARNFMANAEDRVFFAFDSSSLSDNAKEILGTQVNWLKKHENVNVVVQGYCDERGTREYNLALGERRASAVRDYLISQGIAADRISTISYGKERPAVLGNNEAAWAQNRRAVTVVKAGN